MYCVFHHNDLVARVYVRFDTFWGLAGLASGQRHHVRPPLSLLQSSSDFLFTAVLPGTCVVSGILLKYSPRDTLKASSEVTVLMDFGSKFHKRVAFILNEFS